MAGKEEFHLDSNTEGVDIILKKPKFVQTDVSTTSSTLYYNESNRMYWYNANLLLAQIRNVFVHFRGLWIRGNHGAEPEGGHFGQLRTHFPKGAQYIKVHLRSIRKQL